MCDTVCVTLCMCREFVAWVSVPMSVHVSMYLLDLVDIPRPLGPWCPRCCGSGPLQGDMYENPLMHACERGDLDAVMQCLAAGLHANQAQVSGSPLIL